MEPVEAVRRALAAGKRAAIVTVRSVNGTPPSKVGLRLGVTEDGDVFGSLGCDGFDASGTGDAMRAIGSATSVEARYEWDSESWITVDARPLKPGDALPEPSRDVLELLIVGRGPVAKALAALGSDMGFSVRVVAGPEPPGMVDFDDADEVIVTSDYRDVAALRPGLSTYVVICGHDEEFSVPSLKALLGSRAPYLGMMGSRRHTSHLYEELRAAGYEETDLARVHTPVGIDLGAETPEEIALSAVAQIVALRRGGTGRNLDEGIK